MTPLGCEFPLCWSALSGEWTKARSPGSTFFPRHEFFLKRIHKLGVKKEQHRREWHFEPNAFKCVQALFGKRNQIEQDQNQGSDQRPLNLFPAARLADEQGYTDE